MLLVCSSSSAVLLQFKVTKILLLMFVERIDRINEDILVYVDKIRLLKYGRPQFCVHFFSLALGRVSGSQSHAEYAKNRFRVGLIIIL